MTEKTAFLFPGQGSQKVGMGIDFYENYQEAKDVFELASDTLKIDVPKLCAEGPEQALKQTRNTQPLIVTVSCAILEVVFKQFKLEPYAVAGHSVGEYSAIVAGNVVDFRDSVYLVSRRADLMQTAADQYGKGSMAAVIGLSDESVIEICEKFGEDKVQAANFNSHGQVVISGDRDLVLSMIPRFKEAGARLVKELAVSGPWHSRFMEPARLELKKEFDKKDFRNPEPLYFANVSGAAADTGKQIKDLLISQLTNPVYWTKTITEMKNAGISRFIEIGPGNVLTGLMKRIDRELETFNISCVEHLDKLEDFCD